MAGSADVFLLSLPMPLMRLLGCSVLSSSDFVNISCIVIQLCTVSWEGCRRCA